MTLQRVLCGLFMVACVLWGSVLTAQTPPVPSPRSGKPIPPIPRPAMEKVSETIFRLGTLHIDTAKREVTALGHLNRITTVEFVAGTRGSVKGYETAVSLDTDAISFNTALLLIGLDPSRGRAAAKQFDREPPAGDPVEITVSWKQGDGQRRVPIEDLLVDFRTGKALAPGPWVYSGSTFVGSGRERRFLADVEGVLIGLMRAPQALIDSPRTDANFGSIVLNSKLGVPEGTEVTLTVKALDRGSR
jgi:hypothetical protein